MDWTAIALTARLSGCTALMLLVTGLSQSPRFYHRPEVPKVGMTAAMLAAARAYEAGQAQR